MTNDELMHLRRRLKSGEYSGVDIMGAWLALDELVVARKDAERYRWLRDCTYAGERAIHRAGELLTLDELDEAIDAELAGANG